MKKKTRLLMVLPALVVTLGVGPVALGQTAFETFEIQAEYAQPPEPVLPATLSVRARFVTSDAVAPASETVTLEFVPPDPIQPPDPINPLPTTWQLQLPMGCYFEKSNGQFESVDFPACGATLKRFFDDGDYVDLSLQVISMRSSFKPPKGNRTDWRFQLSLELDVQPPTPVQPPQPVVPPQPIRASTHFVVGDDFGQASHSIVSWHGMQ